MGRNGYPSGVFFFWGGGGGAFPVQICAIAYSKKNDFCLLIRVNLLLVAKLRANLSLIKDNTRSLKLSEHLTEVSTLPSPPH